MKQLDIAYPGRVTVADANYPYGSSKNETAPGANDGTPYEIARANDVFGLLYGLIVQCGIVPTNNADTAIDAQSVQAILQMASRGRFFADSGAADAYVLAPVGAVQAPLVYFDGMEAYFVPGNANTGASTVDISGIGAKAILLEGGTVPSAGDIPAGRTVLLRFDLANDRFVTVGLPFATIGEMQTATAVDKATSPGRQDQHPAHAKAKGVFDGNGGVVIADEYNASTIVRTGGGQYSVTFDTPLPDANYAIAITSSEVSNKISGTPTAAGFSFQTNGQAGGATDGTRISFTCT